VAALATGTASGFFGIGGGFLAGGIAGGVLGMLLAT
jgi:hypothetical protein